jgi:hypothetical protein
MSGLVRCRHADATSTSEYTMAWPGRSRARGWGASSRGREGGAEELSLRRGLGGQGPMVKRGELNVN